MRRRFSARALTARLAKFDGRCTVCGQPITAASGLEWDHVIPLELGGADEIENLQPLCRKDHKAKTKDDAKGIAKARRVRAGHMGLRRQAKRKVYPSGFHKRVDGTGYWE